MRLYPPYKKWEVEIQNIEKFRAYLERNIEYFHTNKYATLEGKLQENSFFVRRILSYRNSFRPHIRGIIKQNQSGKHYLILTLESPKTGFYIVAIFGIMMLITAIVQLKPGVLFGIPIIAIWIYITGWFFHFIELEKTKTVLLEIYDIAREN